MTDEPVNRAAADARRRGRPDGGAADFTSATRPRLDHHQPVRARAILAQFGAIRRNYSSCLRLPQVLEGDCIPPHIDHHDFVRPFVTLSLLSEQPILFGKEIKIVEDGIFDAPVRGCGSPSGSVLVLNGNGADVAKHCVPAVSSERVSITFRKMRGVTLGSKKKTVEYKGRTARRRRRLPGALRRVEASRS